MTEQIVQKENKRRLSVCCVGWFLVFALLFSLYIYRAIEFGVRVRTYDKRIEVGMKDLEIVNLLGRYSSFERDHFDGYHFVMVYEGKCFLRDDIILTFDPKTGRLVSKSRGRIYNLINVD